MALTIPQHLAEKTAGFPESSHGANRVTLVLADGRRIHDVFLAWGTEIVRVGGRAVGAPDELGFSLSDITDVVSEVRA
jgi:hypothetical protein